MKLSLLSESISLIFTIAFFGILVSSDSKAIFAKDAPDMPPPSSLSTPHELLLLMERF